MRSGVSAVTASDTKSNEEVRDGADARFRLINEIPLRFVSHPNTIARARQPASQPASQPTVTAAGRRGGVGTLQNQFWTVFVRFLIVGCMRIRTEFN